MKKLFQFWRDASNEELIDLFGTSDIDEIFNKYTDTYIIKTVLDYISED